MEYFRKRINLILVLIITVIILFSRSGPIRATGEGGEQVPYTLEAQDINYDYRAGKIYATGEVTFTAGDIRIRAPEITVEVDENLAVAGGEEVSLETPERKLRGSRLEYNYREEAGEFYTARSRLDELRFSGKVIEIVSDKDFSYRVEEAGFTPCILPDPHYQIKARAVEIYPEDKIVGRRVSLWWGDLMVMWLPFYVMEYTETEDGRMELRETVPLPRLGYDSKYGLILELDYPYRLSEKSRGHLYIKTAQRDKRRIKLDNIYRMKQNLTLKSLYDYDKVVEDDGNLRIDEIASTSLDYRVNESLDIVNTLRYKYQLDEGETEIEKTATSGISYSSGGRNLALNLGYDFHRQQRLEEMNFSYRTGGKRVDFYSRFYNERQDRYSGKLTVGRWNLTYRRGYDVNYLPYLNINLPSAAGFKPHLGLGLIENEGNNFSKVGFKLNYGKSLPLNQFRLYFSGNLAANIYNMSFKEGYHALTGAVGGSYKKRISEKVGVNGSISWSKTVTEGTFLLDGDEVEEEEILNLSGAVELSSGETQSSWELGSDNKYKIDTGEWEDIALRVTRKLDCYSVNVSYDLADKRFTFDISL